MIKKKNKAWDILKNERKKKVIEISRTEVRKPRHFIIHYHTEIRRFVSFKSHNVIDCDISLTIVHNLRTRFG